MYVIYIYNTMCTSNTNLQMIQQGRQPTANSSTRVWALLFCVLCSFKVYIKAIPHLSLRESKALFHDGASIDPLSKLAKWAWAWAFLADWIKIDSCSTNKNIQSFSHTLSTLQIKLRRCILFYISTFSLFFFFFYFFLFVSLILFTSNLITKPLILELIQLVIDNIFSEIYFFNSYFYLQI